MRPLLIMAVWTLIAVPVMAKPIGAEDAAQFKIGVATVADVESKLGKPMMTTMNSDGSEVIAYGASRGRAKAMTFVPVVGMFAGGAVGHSSTLLFQFDAHGLLKSSTASSATVNCSTGIVGAGCTQ